MTGIESTLLRSKMEQSGRICEEARNRRMWEVREKRWRIEKASRINGEKIADTKRTAGKEDQMRSPREIYEILSLNSQVNVYMCLGPNRKFNL